MMNAAPAFLLLDRRAADLLKAIADRPADQLLRTDEAAAVLGVNPNFLDRRRCDGYGEGPRFVRLGGAVRYRIDDLRKWLDARAAAWEARRPVACSRRIYKATLPPPRAITRVRLPEWCR